MSRLTKWIRTKRDRALTGAKPGLSLGAAKSSENGRVLLSHAAEAAAGAAGLTHKANAGLSDYVDSLPQVLQFRRAFYETYGRVASGSGLPVARAWPESGDGLSYKDKLTRHLGITVGTGAEIGPLNIPLVSKAESRVLYVDHLNTEELRKKYPTVTDLVDIDRSIPSHGDLADALSSDVPLDYLIASQVFEHVPNPIKWLKGAASVLRTGGRFALSLPDRRFTFDMFREETKPAEIVAAYLNEDTIPNLLSVYDNQTLATAVNTFWMRPDSLSPDEIIAGRGAVSPPIVQNDHMSIVQLALDGEYLDEHCWVFTPPSFLLLMAQLASDSFLHFRCHQFYPTDKASADRGSSSFTIVLEKVEGALPAELKRSFLMALGESTS